MKIEIKHRWGGQVIFSFECDSTKEAVVEAVKQKADLYGAYLRGAYLRGAYLYGAYLRGADLRGADLCGADLCGANLYDQKIIDGGLRSDGYRFLLTCFGDEGWRVKAGCRNLAWTDARQWWITRRGGTPLGDETMAILDHMERLAKIRGWELPAANCGEEVRK